jgi:hypothetical protein
MRRRFIPFIPVLLGLLVVQTPRVLALNPAANGPVAVETARVVINGTSNIHAYTAESKDVRLVSVKVANPPAAATFWNDVLKPGELQAFEIALRADSLHSTKDGLDKNMHKALKAEQHQEIAFRLTRLDAAAAAGKKAVGVLRVAGVEREVTLDLTLVRRDAALVVSGQTAFLMTDFGITPPKAMLGMLKTDPKVTINFETVLSLSAH